MDNHLSWSNPKLRFNRNPPVNAEEGLLGSVENIIAEKRKLVEAVPEDGLAIFNYDDQRVRKIGREFRGNKIFYGLDKKADVWADQIEVTLKGTRLKIHDGKESLSVKTGLLGYPAVYACLAA
jgi:UDP-N-acetylmuramoyl-tripeptide--D-alanyl-D-alanine ligase